MKLWDEIRLTEAGMARWREVCKTDPPRTVGKISSVSWDGTAFNLEFPKRQATTMGHAALFFLEDIEPLRYVGVYKDAHDTRVLRLRELYGAFYMEALDAEGMGVACFDLKDEELMTMYMDLGMVLKGKGLI